MDNLIVSDSELEKLAEGFEFTEGPAADTDGNIFFTDQPNDRILKWSISGQLSTFLQPSGRANGLYTLTNLFRLNQNIAPRADRE